MRFRFPKARIELKESIKYRNRQFAVRLTPFGTVKHIRIGTMDAEMRAISIPDSTQALILIDREALESRVHLENGESLLLIDEEIAIEACRMIDNEVSTNKKLVKRWTQKAEKSLARMRNLFKGVRRNPDNSKESREIRRLKKENRRLEDLLNKEAGTVVEMMDGGLIPTGEKAPIPMRRVQQMQYGCDWLSLAWKQGKLHLFWIESNLSRTGKTPSLTANEKRFRDAIKQGKVVNHYRHHWVDGEGKHHWK